jgi:hypothetical protein
MRRIRRIFADPDVIKKSVQIRLIRTIRVAILLKKRLPFARQPLIRINGSKKSSFTANGVFHRIRLLNT